MEIGLNSDISVSGIQYHLQSEDWGAENQYLVSRIYRDGQVIRTFRRSYKEVLAEGPVSTSEALRLALKDQHLRILDLLISGKMDLKRLE